MEFINIVTSAARSLWKGLLKNKYVFFFLIPLMMLIFDLVFFWYAISYARNVILEEKNHEITHGINMIDATVKTNKDLDHQTLENLIISNIEFIDNIPEVYGAAYRFDTERTLITNRHFEFSDINPFEFEVFEKVIESGGSGRIPIEYTPEGQRSRVLHIYFRWTTIGDVNYLLLGGLSQYSIQNELDFWTTRSGHWRSIWITLIWNMWAITILVNSLRKRKY